MEFISFFTGINNFISNYYFLLGVQSTSLCFKMTLLYFFVIRIFKSRHVPTAWYYLLIILIASSLEDFSWVTTLSSRTILPTITPTARLFIIRIGWAANVIAYQTLSLFIETFIQKPPRLAWYQYIFIPISSAFFAFFLVTACYNFTIGQSILEMSVQTYQSIYVILILMPFTILIATYSLRKEIIPRILAQQLITVIQFLLLPHLIANLYQVYPFTFLIGKIANNCAAVGISGIFLTLALYYCVRKIIGLRFLDIHSHVHALDSDKFNFVKDFKSTLEELGNSSSTSEIRYIVQHFFNHAFKIPTPFTFLYVRTIQVGTVSDTQSLHNSTREVIVENFIGAVSSKPHLITQALEKLKTVPIFSRDEIEYNNFYENNEVEKTIISFLDSINADIFIPIYEEGRIIASIVIERHARAASLYTNVERDEMLVFASYLSKIINLLQNRNLNELLKQRKEIMEELYFKHQEINQYKESIRSFLRANKESNFGILFYKNRKFSFGTKNSSEIIAFNPNVQDGDPLTKILRSLAQQVELYKTTQTIITKDAVGKKLVISAIPQPETHSIIFIVHYPEISDVVKQLVDHVKDPSAWDYLLYLETTQSGKLINELVPGTGETLINFKINLLKLALSKKALLLELAQDDLLPTVELLHHISLRETLYTLDIQSPASGNDLAIKLFGINPLFGSVTAQPLLDRLNKKGTLFIKNIHFLDKETQDMLAECIRYGYYRVFKSEKKMQADVRIICSTNQNLSHLVQKGIFSASLYNELCQASLSLPSLMTLSQEELETLIRGFSEQALQNNPHNNLLMLSDKDKEKIITQKPISLHELKTRVQSILVHKTRKNDSFHDMQFNPAYNISDPKLVEASRLGKYALKDPKVMDLLWSHFKNQNKIALFLGVNRSSVNRRCKEYGLL